VTDEQSHPEVSDEATSLATRLLALGSTQRLRIVAELLAGELHVSELARRVEMSRALLYMHLTKLEAAGFVSGRLELGDDGKAVKIFKVVPFDITVNPEVIAAAVSSHTPNKE
jgi:DNA-binding transcriptional ArsR family regulator